MLEKFYSWEERVYYQSTLSFWMNEWNIYF